MSGGLGQAFVVPADVHQLTVTVRGGAGGLGGKEGGSGGRGGERTFTLPVTAGDNLSILLGKRGQDADADSNALPGNGAPAGGPEKGGNGGQGQAGAGAGGGGGGGTEIKLNGELIAVAAGGGGGGGRNATLANDGGNGGSADADGSDGSGPQADGGHVGDAGSEAGGLGDTAVNPGFFGGGAGGGGGGYEGGSGGDTNFGGSGAGGGGGRNYFDASVLTPVDGSWSNNVEKDGSVSIKWATQFATAISIDDPNVVVTGQMKGYKVTVTAAGSGQTPTGSLELTAENTGTGVVTPLGTKNLVAGKTTIYSDALKVGSYTLHASYTPNGVSDSLPSTGDRDFAVVKGDTSTLIAGPLDPPNLNEPVDLGVSVTATAPAKGIPTGQVKFYQGGVPIPGGTVTLDGSGKAVLTTTHLKVGTSDITANYLGDDEFNASVDEVSLQAFVVNQGDVSIAIDQEHSTVISGEKSKFNVTVKPVDPSAVDPTGTVQFYVDDQPLGGPLAVDPHTGKVHFEVELPVSAQNGHFHIRAVYSGDDNYHQATSDWIDHFVNFGDAKVTLSSSLNPSHVGNEVTFSIDVDGLNPTKPYEPTGDVQLYVGNHAFNGPVTIDAQGKATITTDALPVGENAVYAQYLGDDRYNEASSGVLNQVVQKQLTAVTLTANDTEIQYKENLTLTAHVATEKGDLATGTVQFYDNGVKVGAEVPVDGLGNATVSSDKVSKGTHQYSAIYSGDVNNNDGVSNSLEVKVNPNLLQFKLITNKVPAYEGEDIVLHARLASIYPSTGKIAGSVQYYSDGNTYGLPIPVNGQNWGSRVVRNLKPGIHRFTARFIPSAESSYDTNTSGGVIQRVLKGHPNAKVSLSAKRISASEAAIRVRVRKMPSKTAAHGFVQIYVDGTPVKLLKLPDGAGVRTYTLTGLPDRQVFVTANYRPRGSTKQAGKSITVQQFK